MDLQVTQQKLDHVLLFTIDVNLVSGRRRVKPEDIQEAKGVVIQEDDVMTLGSKKVFNPEKLRIFERLKNRMHGECMRRGSAFLSGYAIPETKADDLAKALNAIVGEAGTEINDLLKNYQKSLDDYCAERPEWAATIRANAYPEQYVRDRLRFSFNAVRVSSAREEGVMAVNLHGQVSGLLGSVLGDVADEARTLQDKSLAGKDQKTRKVLRPLKAAAEKLQGFAFLDRRVTAIVEMINTVLAAMPADGVIQGPDLAMLWGVTSLLIDPAKALTVAQHYEVDGKDKFLASLRPKPVAAPSQSMDSFSMPGASAPISDLASVSAMIMAPAATQQDTRPIAAEVPQAPPMMPPPIRASGFGALAGFRR